MHYQTEMLKQISEKLNLIEEGIKTILKDLDEPKRLVGDVPDEMVLKEYNTKMTGGTSN
jgi:hypothetical protein